MAPRILPRAEHNVSRKDIDADALNVLYRLKNHGFLAYLVGGGVRDLLLERQPKDIDIGTNAHPQQVKKLFRNCFVVGRRFRLCHVRFGRKVVEVSTFRRQAPAEEGDTLIRRDNTFGTPEEDAFRRDFTVNALFYDIATFSVIDYVDGLEGRDGAASSARSATRGPVPRGPGAHAARGGAGRAARLHDRARHAGGDPRPARRDREEQPRAHPRRDLQDPAPGRVAARPSRCCTTSACSPTCCRRRTARSASRASGCWAASAASTTTGTPASPPRTSSAIRCCSGRCWSRSAFPCGASPPSRPRAAARRARRGGDDRRRGGDGGARRGRRTSAGWRARRPLSLPFARRDVERLRLILAAQNRLRELHTSPRVKGLLIGKGYLEEALRWMEIHGGVQGQELAAHWRGLELAPDAASDPALTALARTTARRGAPSAAPPPPSRAPPPARIAGVPSLGHAASRAALPDDEIARRLPGVRGLEAHRRAARADVHLRDVPEGDRVREPRGRDRGVARPSSRHHDRLHEGDAGRHHPRRRRPDRATTSPSPPASTREGARHRGRRPARPCLWSRSSARRSRGREDAADLDVRDAAAVRARVLAVRPDVVLNATAYNKVDAAETERDEAFAVNEQGPRNLAAAAPRRRRGDRPRLDRTTSSTARARGPTPRTTRRIR